MPEMKICTKCEKEKSIDEFRPRKERPIGRVAWCRECDNKRARLYKLTNHDTVLAKKHIYYMTNREKLNAESREYQGIHKKERNLHGKYRYQTDFEYKMKGILRARLRRALRRNAKTGSAIRDLGCTLEYLKSHIEDQFQEGMTWDNWGEWHLDHIRPLASFDLTDSEQLCSACRYTNLQPLWAEENMRKGSMWRGVAA